MILEAATPLGDLGCRLASLHHLVGNGMTRRLTGNLSRIGRTPLASSADAEKADRAATDVASNASDARRVFIWKFPQFRLTIDPLADDGHPIYWKDILNGLITPAYRNAIVLQVWTQNCANL